MADLLSKAERSARMAKVRSTGNASTEQRLAYLLRAHGITGWRRKISLPGKPDFVFRSERVAVFVDGCFWHACPSHGRVPKSRVAFWKTKLERNAQRDRVVTRTLKAAGWTVVRIWECSLSASKAKKTLSRMARTLAMQAGNSETTRR